MVCHNPGTGGAAQAEAAGLVLKATEKSLEKIGKEVTRRKNKLFTAAEIGVKVEKVLGRYKMEKHFVCTIGEGSFAWSRCAESIDRKRSWMGFMC